MSCVVGLPNNSYKPITNTAWVPDRLCKLQKGCTRLATASDKVYQLLAHGRWFSPGTPASSTTKTGRHDIAAILLKVALKYQKSINQSIIHFWSWWEWKRAGIGFTVGDPIITMGVIPLPTLIPTHVCACHKLGHGLAAPYVGKFV